MKKVLIIEDDVNDFGRISGLFDKTYGILPKDFDKMSRCIEFPQTTGKNIVDYAIQQINENYKDLALILCDIKLGHDWRGGIKVVKAMRKHKILGSPNWTSSIPIIAITNYAEKQEGIIDAGADFSLNKAYDDSLISALVEATVDSYDRRLEFMYPSKLKDEIMAFKATHANEKTAFIMTSFAEEHQNTIALVKEVLKKYDITPCMANKQGGENTDDLWPNIEVFIHGCDFGIGIYADDSILKGKNEAGEKKYENGDEREKEKEKELFKRIRINPNLSQEVGYMLGIQKKVCILKDGKLKHLPTDLAGKIYVPFENDEDLKKNLGEWIEGKILRRR